MRWMRPLVAAGLTAAAAACSDQQTTAPTAAPRDAAPVMNAASDRGIPNSYIVVLNEGANPRSVAAVAGVAPRFVYENALLGFAATLTAGQLNALQHNPSVKYLEQDQKVAATTTQSGATWGIDRIDQRDLPLSGTYTYTPTGAGVTAYVIDTGILVSHTEFGGRASVGYDAVGDGRGGIDCNGHGTHVAGTIGSATYGVAKGVTLKAVRVLDCTGSGTNSGVIAGVDWVRLNHATPAVANMSLGGGASTALDAAVTSAISSGVTFAVAAGNDNLDACTGSPSRVATALTVGATTSTDARASYSDYGSCVDLFAPGSSILSTWYSSTTATNTISGTSMATPHVVGVAALYLQGNPSASAATVSSAILSSATPGKVTSPGTGSPNLLLYSPLTAPTTGGGGTDPCTGCTKYTGSLTGTGSYQYQPSGTYYQTFVTGYQKGWLQGPTGTDFDLYLLKWNGSAWVQVAASESSSSTESISYNGTAGYYMWKVYSYSGSGAYSFWQSHP
jgi:subtilisin family serine protease